MRARDFFQKLADGYLNMVFNLKLTDEHQIYCNYHSAYNHHLPDVPSEKEVIESGLDLGEMNKLLLKKVEELTLYLIEKDQKDNIQKEQINNLKKG
jgi:hypothetical protein